MEAAYEMAVDALGLAITSRKTEGIEVPKASQPDEVESKIKIKLLALSLDEC